MELTWAGRIQQQAIELGRLLESRQLVLNLLEKRFGNLPAATTKQIEAMDIEELHRLGMRLLDAESLDDLELC